MVSEDSLVTVSVKLYKWQKELLEKKSINKSELIRNLLTQYFKGSGNVSSAEYRRAIIEEAKETIRKAEEKREEVKAELLRLKETIYDDIREFIETKFSKLDKLLEEYDELIEKAKEKVREAEELDKAVATIEQKDEESELKGLIEEVYDDVLERGVDGWVRDNIAGANGIKVRFYKVLPKMAKERGIKVDLKRAKEIIQKYYPEIAKYLE